MLIKKTDIVVLILFVVFLVFINFYKSEVKAMNLSSESIKNGEKLPNEQVLNSYGCDGNNISPDLSWSDFSHGTKSFALVVHDPDAPKENGWYHWIVVNIPVDVTSIKKGQKLPSPSMETVTDFDTFGYGGACPPVGHGVHHYNFTIYALDTDFLDVEPNIRPNTLHQIIKSHAKESATITATYER